MSKAEHDTTTPSVRPLTAALRPLPPGEQLQPMIEQLKALAAKAADTLFLAEGPPHPDGPLLDLSAEILHLSRLHNEFFNDKDYVAARKGAMLIRALLTRAAKLPATSPAGIYAKALLVGASRGLAPVLATSLAAELIACRALRESLWPVDAATGEASHAA